ncbi:MAG: hypothetical protein ACREUL_03515 [Steroidobacteraceae bacterium]
MQTLDDMACGVMIDRARRAGRRRWWRYTTASQTERQPIMSPALSAGVQ